MVLTNLKISETYRDCFFYMMMSEVQGAFAY